MNVKVKICGMQSIESAEKALAAGAAYIGFIFVKDSKRAIDHVTAKKIITKMKGKITIVGVFRKNTVEEINRLCKELDLDLVQLHGDEDQEFCRKIIRPVIKSFGLPKDFSVDETIRYMKKYDVQYYLLDRQTPGEGESLLLKNAAAIGKMFPLFFAGGLTPENVADAVREIKPFAVDVISGVKTDGKFDFDKMKKFVENAKGVKV